jgi:hypothetical protein
VDKVGNTLILRLINQFLLAPGLSLELVLEAAGVAIAGGS